MLDVIASEAKQSRGSKQELDCFVARAPRNDGEMFVMSSRKLPRFPDAVRHLPDANASRTCRSARSGHPFTSPVGDLCKTGGFFERRLTRVCEHGLLRDLPVFQLVR